MTNSVKPGIYRHFKGGTVRVLKLATHSDDKEEPLVVYVGIQNGEFCARPLSSFNEIVKNKDGIQVPRFTFEEEREDVIKQVFEEEQAK